MNDDPADKPLQPKPQGVSTPPPAPSPVQEAEPPTSPLSESTAPPSPPTGVVTSKPKRKGLLVAGIIALVLVVLGGGAALAYNFWYQNPEKVITDGLVHAIKAESVVYTGSIKTSDSQGYNVEITGSNKLGANDLRVKATFKQGEKDVTVNGQAILDSNGDIYFMVKDVKTLLKDYREAIIDPEARELFDNLIAKIDNKWIKISANDVKAFSEDIAKSQQCIGDTLKKLQSDSGMLAEVADVYKANKFITVDKKLGSQNGSLGYQLSSNKDKAKEFARGMENTKLYKSLHDCDSSITLNADDFTADSSANDTRTELWVTRWTHQITKFSVETTQGTDKMTMVVEPKFNEKVTIKAPENSITIGQLSAELKELLQLAEATPPRESTASDSSL